jgi:Spy/CpxP family protein refolding chaperone
MKTALINRSLNKFSLCSLATTFLLAGGLLVQAQSDPNQPARPRPPGDRPRAERGEARPQPQPGGPGLAQIERVLTEEQREDMRSIMMAQREAMRETNEKIRVARQDLLKAVLADSFNEDTVRAKAMAVAKLEAELTVMRAKALAQMQPPLSDEQMERIKNAPQERMQPGAGDPRRSERPPRPPQERNQPRPQPYSP